MLQCTNCDQENRIEARFCSNCGATLEVEEEIVEAESRPSVSEFTELPDPIDEISSSKLELSDESEVALVENEPPSDELERLSADSLQGEADDSSINLEEEPENVPENNLPPLEDGTWITKRYYILQNQIEDSLRTYEVEDHALCPACETEIVDESDERFCIACGADLQDESLPWAIIHLEEHLEEVAEPQNDNMTFAWAERFFRPLHDSAFIEEKALVSREFNRGVNLLAGQRSDVGMVRADQPDEDSIFSLTISGVYESHAQPTIGLYMVADGMGGHGDGEVASRLATETISNFLLQTTIVPLLRGERFSPNTITAHIESAIQDANRRVIEDAQARGNDMGTTVTLLMVIDEMAYVANVGDSRTYLWGQEGLALLTEDHSTVFKLFSAGELSEEDIYTHPKRSEIYRCLGFELELEVDHFTVELTPDITFILCCDGLWEMVRCEGISDVLMLGMNDPLAVCDELVKRANQAGGEDNISVVVVRVTG